MTDHQPICTSCKTTLTNMKGGTSFLCPQCTQYTIVRCASCRRLASKYMCPNCSFEGPN